MENIKLLYIDLFCGAGGTSTGVEHAKLDGTKCARVVACVNHDANAIASHQANHPDTLHFTEDIRTLDLIGLTAHLNRMRMKYPSALGLPLNVPTSVKPKAVNHAMQTVGRLQNIFSVISSS